jgi:hypothetical protein
MSGTPAAMPAPVQDAPAPAAPAGEKPSVNAAGSLDRSGSAAYAGPAMPVRAPVAALLCLTFSLAVSAGAEERRIFEGSLAWEHPERAHVTEQELLFNDRASGGFQSRSYYFTGSLEGGEHLEISVFQWEYGLFGGWGYQVVVASPGAPPFVVEERIPDRAITAATDRFLIRFGDSVLAGSDGHYLVRMKVEGFRCELSFDSRVPPWSPGDGYARLDPDRGVYIRYGVAAPLARVRGTLTIGDRTRTVQGWGYADRGLIAAPINRMNSPTYAFRGFGPVASGEEVWLISLLRYESHPEFGPVDIPVVFVIEDSRWVFASKDIRFSAADFVEDEGMSVPYPRRLEVHATQRTDAGTVTLDGVFLGSTLYHYSDVFEEIPPFFRKIIQAFFHRPIIFRMLGTFHGTVRLPDGTLRQLRLEGHAEYTVVD